MVIAKLLLAKIIGCGAGLSRVTRSPIILGILAFHLRYAPMGLPLAVLLVVLEVYLAWAYRRAFAPMLQSHVEPTASLHPGAPTHAGAHA